MMTTIESISGPQVQYKLRWPSSSRLNIGETKAWILHRYLCHRRYISWIMLRWPRWDRMTATHRDWARADVTAEVRAVPKMDETVARVFLVLQQLVRHFAGQQLSHCLARYPKSMRLVWSWQVPNLYGMSLPRPVESRSWSCDRPPGLAYPSRRTMWSGATGRWLPRKFALLGTLVRLGEGRDGLMVIIGRSGHSLGVLVVSWVETSHDHFGNVAIGWLVVDNISMND
jgi:hypothetical protein